MPRRRAQENVKSEMLGRGWPHQEDDEEEEEEEESGGSCGGGDSSFHLRTQPSHNQPFRLVATVGAPPPSNRRYNNAGSATTEDGILTVLGGKASCRRKFVLHVELRDAQGGLVPQDLSIMASVAFSHDYSAVSASDIVGEPPLFTTFNGVEFSAHDNPTRMSAGRATFKLALSLLSSKFDNHMFCICFTPINATFACEPCYSTPIRSISRKRTQPAPPPHLTATIPDTSSEDQFAGVRRLSPTASASPSSATLTSESCNPDQNYHHFHNGFRHHSPHQHCPSQPPSCTCCSTTSAPQQRPLSAPSTSRPASDAATFQPGAHLLGNMQQMCSTAALAPPLSQRLDSLMRSFISSSAGGGGSNPRRRPRNDGDAVDTGGSAVDQCGGASDEQLQEEERAIHYLELSLFEVSREVQKRKEEVRLKRRRLMDEEESRLQNLIYQSSTWINSFHTKFNPLP